MGSENIKLSITDLKKSFGNNHVLRGISLDIPKGKSLVVIGGSGTGKSVLIKSVLGIVTPDSGSIKIDGVESLSLDHEGRDALMQKFGMLFQGGALFDSLPVWENITFNLLQTKKIHKKDARDVAVANLKSVGLGAHVADLFPSELSGGMQKRVALARAVASKPEIIFFDEPTTGLDPIMADVINDLIVSCTEELGATTLSITHDMASVRKIADHVAMIYQGQIIWHGAIDDIDHANNPYLDQFIHGKAEGPIHVDI